MASLPIGRINDRRIRSTGLTWESLSNDDKPSLDDGFWVRPNSWIRLAAVLTDLGLPQDSLLLSLVSFNVGVELGQLAIVAAFLPLAYFLRRSWSYPRLVLTGGSLVVIAIELVWFTERAFDLRLFPL